MKENILKEKSYVFALKVIALYKQIIIEHRESLRFSVSQSLRLQVAPSPPPHIKIKSLSLCLYNTQINE